MDPTPQKIDLINIEDEMQNAYIDYSMSVIIGRALPDACDGLKPVNRRILYAMRQGGWAHNRPFVKCARVVGEVMGKYHPHGDSAVYDSLVRMAQNFSLRYPLIHGQGNFGSIDGDPPAAQRYTECKLNRLSDELLSEIDQQTVNMRANYDETLQEPHVLPSRIPNLLANGSTGIAVGMATNIPPHNLNELIDASIHLIDFPDATIDQLMEFVKGPDFPTGGIIHGLGPIRNMYETGRGLIKVRGRAGIEEGSHGKESIIITEIPYMLNKLTLIKKMVQLVHDKKLEGISDIRDESDKDGIRLVVETKRGALPKVVLNNVFKQTPLESTFGAILLAIDGGRPHVMNLKRMLQCFIQHRFEVMTRKTQFALEKAEARAHILEGLKIALDNLDEVVKTIREAKDRATARAHLIQRFGLSEIQANAILEMRLYQLTGLEQNKVEEEYLEVIKQINYLRDLLAHPKKIYGIIKEDLTEIRKTYGDERRTDIVAAENEINIEDLIADKPTVITISHSGYIKRVPTNVYREQRRGGKGVMGMNTKDEDFAEHVFMASTHDYILFFTQNGRVYWKKVYDIPEGTRTSKGKAIVNLLEINREEKIAAMIRVREFSETESLVFATQKGVVKKSQLSGFKRPRAGGIIAINIDTDDELIDVKLTNGNDRVMLITRQGMSVQFHEERLQNQGRATRGVRGITLGKKDDQVVSIEVVDPRATLLTIAENGYGKRTAFGEYPVRNRGGKGVITIRTTERNGKVIGAHSVQDNDAIMLITEAGQMIRMGTKDLRTISRNTQGVRLINLKKDDKLVSSTIVHNDGESETSENEDISENTEES
ncbi:MAG: DNA gyrase subunit A [Kiritimatiellae bacterium]|nr:DNA gyrase subunit A [Kiritimatiellia bacterium]